jgi:hypothetical protein
MIYKVAFSLPLGIIYLADPEPRDSFTEESTIHSAQWETNYGCLSVLICLFLGINRVGGSIVKMVAPKPGRKYRSTGKHFVCTSCHNSARDPNLMVSDPGARLTYTAEG